MNVHATETYKTTCKFTEKNPNITSRQLAHK